MKEHRIMLNWLRAAVLGANDGIVSVASLIVGVAGATADARTILMSGIAGTVAGAFSMAAGEYVSVSSQRDAEEVRHARTKEASVATQDAHATEVSDEPEFTNPWHAALASGVSFFSGASVPLLAVYAAPTQYTFVAALCAVVLALSLTGVLSAEVGGASKRRATLRLIVGGLIAMSVTYAAGSFFGVNI